MIFRLEHTPYLSVFEVVARLSGGAAAITKEAASSSFLPQLIWGIVFIAVCAGISRVIDIMQKIKDKEKQRFFDQ